MMSSHFPLGENSAPPNLEFSGFLKRHVSACVCMRVCLCLSESSACFFVCACFVVMNVCVYVFMCIACIVLVHKDVCG